MLYYNIFPISIIYNLDLIVSCLLHSLTAYKQKKKKKKKKNFLKKSKKVNKNTLLQNNLIKPPSFLTNSI